MSESMKDLFDFYVGSQERATPSSHETVRVNYEDFLTLRRVVAEELEAKDAEIESLAAERDEILNRNDRILVGYGVALDHLARVTAERDELRAVVEEALDRLEDMYQGDDGQAWKECYRFLERHRPEATREAGGEA